MCYINPSMDKNVVKINVRKIRCVWLRKLNMALHYTNGHLVLIEHAGWLKSVLGRVCANTKRKVELILNYWYLYIINMLLYAWLLYSWKDNERHWQDFASNFKRWNLTSMHLEQLNVTQVDGGRSSICQHWGLQKMLLCIYVTKKLLQGHPALIRSQPHNKTCWEWKKTWYREHEVNWNRNLNFKQCTARWKNVEMDG